MAAMELATPPRKQPRFLDTSTSEKQAQVSAAAELKPVHLPMKEQTPAFKEPASPQPRMCRLTQKLPAAFVFPDDQSAGPMPSSLGTAISDQLLKSGASFGRRQKTLAWLQGRAVSGEAQMHGRIILEADIEEARKNMRSVRAKARRQAGGGAATKRKMAADNGEADDEAGDNQDGKQVDKIADTEEASAIAPTPANRLPTKRKKASKRRSQEEKAEELSHAEQGKVAPSASNSEDGSESGSDSSYSSGGTDSESETESKVSDLSAEEEVDAEIDGGPGLWKDLMREALEQHEDPNYRGDWTGAPQPGNDDFNEFATGVMSAAGLDMMQIQADLNTTADCPNRQPHQECSVFLLHPKSPVSRLLVDHPTGSGKTREMIEVLDNYFFDPRPKVPIFPKEPVCRNFYVELLRWPSRYRDFFCLLRPEHASRVAQNEDWRSVRSHLWTGLAVMTEEEVRAMCKEVREVLEMKSWFYMGYMRRSIRAAFAQRFPGEPMPGAPLRALRYTSAGGMHSQLREEDGLPRSALFKIGFDQKGTNVYSNKIVIMDEVHNLVRTQTMFGTQLERLRELLQSAKCIVLAGFTGTPILSEPHEGRQLLDIIKGHEAVGRGDGGFISSFPMRPVQLFPRSLPRGLPDAVLTPQLCRQFVRKVDLFGEVLQKYDSKRAEGMPIAKLRAYCNMCVYFGAFHDGKNGSKARVLQEFQFCAPKLQAIAEDVAGSSLKTVVLIERRTGMDALLEFLRKVAHASEPAFGVATMDELADFNAPENLRGDRLRVLVADASQCSEGVSFFAVRRMLLADVATSPTALVQSVGRCIRMYGHRGLPEHEQTVTTTLYAAGFPRWMRSPLGAWAYRSQRKTVDAQAQTSQARHLLRTLKRSGIRTLETLKERIDSYSRQLNPSAPAVDKDGQSSLGAADAVGFYESIGMWQEAEMVRLSLQRKGKARQRKAKKAPRVDSEQAQAQPGQPRAQHNTKHWLVRALQVIHASSDVSEVVKSLHLSSLTADEEVLHNLSFASNAIVASLKEMRRSAVDRTVLKALMPTNTLASETEGEAQGESRRTLRRRDTENEYAITSESSGGESRPMHFKQEKQEVPLILPPGWTVQKFKRGNSVVECREFVDPNGVRYRTLAMAQQAVAAQRRAANISDMLRSKFEAKLQRTEMGSKIVQDQTESSPENSTENSPESNVFRSLPQQISAPEDTLASDAGDAAIDFDGALPSDHAGAELTSDQGSAAIASEDVITSQEGGAAVVSDQVLAAEQREAASASDHVHVSDQDNAAVAPNGGLLTDQGDLAAQEDELPPDQGTQEVNNGGIDADVQ